MKADNPCRPVIWGFLLAVSLGVNALLAYLYARNHAAPPPSPRYFRTEPVDLAGATVARADPTGRPDLRPRSDLVGLIESWRQAGAEERVVRSLAIALVQDRFAGQMAELAYPRDKPFWEMGATYRAQTAGIESRKNALLAEVLGEAVDLTGPQERTIQERIYGNLPPAKMQEVLRIASVFRQRREKIAQDDPNRSEQLGQLTLLQREEIARLLSPAELTEYDRAQASSQGQTTGP